MELPPRVVLDTNVLVSAIVFGGTPRRILERALRHNLIAVTSPPLLVECSRVLSEKFRLSPHRVSWIDDQLRQKFDVVTPKQKLQTALDEPDNRVLEAAVEGNVQIVVTGDNHLLDIPSFRKIKIVTPTQFLERFSQ